MSAPLSYIAGAAVLPPAGSLKPERSVSSDVLDVDLDVRVDRLDAGLVAGLELLDQVVVDAADEADVVGLGLQGGRDTDEEGALLLGEGEVGDVVVGACVGVEAVDDRELDVGVVWARPR